jgi:hypothetical protein
MRKVPNKSVLTAVFFALLAGALAFPDSAGAQMHDDKMMPPVLLVPPPVDPSPVDILPQDLLGEDSLDDEPLSIYEVPLLNVPLAASGEAGEKPLRIGRFSLLHKVTAKITGIELRAGEEATIGDLSLTMHDCITASPEEPPETRAFLQISEFKLGTDRPLFSGWMFASSPGLNALEHPVFDLWPLACVTEDGLPYTGDVSPPAPVLN